jgi:hypothetical protein
MTVFLPNCFKCKYYNRYDPDKHSCKAFPRGMPEKVFYNKIDHDHIIEGQTGEYVFEEDKED